MNDADRRSEMASDVGEALRGVLGDLRTLARSQDSEVLERLRKGLGFLGSGVDSTELEQIASDAQAALTLPTSSQTIARVYERLWKAAVSSRPELARDTPRRISSHNPWRSLFHLAAGVGAAFLYRFGVDAEGAVAICILASALGLILELFRRRQDGFNRWFMATTFVRKVARPHEHHRVWSSTYFAWGLTVSVLLTPPIAVQVACIVLAFADPAASMVGRAINSPKLLEAKSVGGTSAFFVVGTLSAWGYLSVFSDLPLGLNLLLATSAAFAGAIAELFSRKLDDNFTIPIAASLAVALILPLHQ